MERETALALLGLLIICVTSAPVKKERDVDIYSFHINSTVNSRYAVSVISSRVANRLNQSREVHFQVKIPKNAFISKFRMTIDGKPYDGVVKRKEEAQQQYSEAVSRGESAGLVGSVGRTLEEFRTSVTVAALSKVTFELTYEELLKRRLGNYQLRIHAQPMQPVADFKIDVHITENPGVSFLEVKGELRTQDLSSAVISTIAESSQEAWVNFYPTREQQTKCESCGEDGLNGDLIIEYDVRRQNQNGELQALNGFFVHYFAPTDIQQIPKNVVFLIDRSGSMRGQKIHQTRQAMLKVLGDLSEDDYFGLITFDSSVHVWNPELLRATESAVEQAKAFVREIPARGGTNINQAVLNGVELINSHPRQGSASILILLTDGDPTSGETNTARIQNNVKEAIGGKFPLYCLGFGFDVNFDFLEKMALENDGVARRIYEASDAALQLQGFYEEVATPLLTHVQLKYPGAANLTQTSFRQYYNGSEIVVAGQITDNSVETFHSEIVAVSKSRNVTYHDSVSAKDLMDVSPQHESFIQRLWAYLTVKQLLETEVALKGEEKKAAKKKALDLSLRYEFVTPLTSMVVTKPQGEETQVAHKPKEGAESHKQHHPMPVPHLLLDDVPDIVQTYGGRQSYPSRTPAGQPLGEPGLTGVPGPPGQPGLTGILHLPERSVLKASDEPDWSVVMYDSPRGSGSRRILPPPPPPPPPHPMPTFFIPQVLPTTTTSTTSTTSKAAVSVVRFIISTQPHHICYDTPAGHKLHLFSDASSDFSINGQLSDEGFSLVAVHYKSATLLVSPVESVYSDGQSAVKFVWGEPEPSRHESDDVAIFQRSTGLDVTMGSVRVLLLLHKKNGEVFLWPVVHQTGNNANIRGILGKNDLHFEELPGSTLKIQDQEVEAPESSAVDYRFPAAPGVKCRLVPFRSVQQGELSDFTVSQL